MGNQDYLTDEEIKYIEEHFNDLPIWNTIYSDHG